jgi:hypothetical protein
MSLPSLISASLKQEEISFLKQVPSNLMSEMEQAAIAWIVGYTRKYKHTPSIERFSRSEHAGFVTKHLISSPLEDLYDMTIESLRHDLFLEGFH